ncbi:heterodisulfide reductase-related iron-sulfur binding cluster [Blastochloris sulfoviridis]|uniref:4Fe-4S dicluster domain-containing protein n=1 Tax=Blastochloris sulfoviridis TaxID=50712 RepID=A0A5M6HNE1_9HYPH|nr:heterodisulfide reductase-related iron-sulfur binding cluster [Blastochloris sulfoviridis]KAA5597188.1 4Fe-4S dicluster domain-containing protein [Blastochloris sulfoviridis]
MQTRDLFWQMSPIAVQVFYGIGIAAMATFLAAAVHHANRYRRGTAADRPVDWAAGVRRMVSDLLAHRTLDRRDRYAGIGHRLIFFGFVTLLAGTLIITLDYDVMRPLTGVSFWHGWFYLAFSLVVDVAGVVLIAGIVMMMARRALFALPKLDYQRAYRGETDIRPQARRWQVEDWAFLSLLLAIAVSGFVQEATRLLIDRPPLDDLSPVGAMLARLMEAAGVDSDAAVAIRKANWWLHAVLALAFVGTVAITKGKHTIAAIASLAMRDTRNVARLPAPREGAPVGVSRLEEMSWRDLLHFDACTKCGRCHEACPARVSGYPLSPRDLILDLRLYAESGLPGTAGRELLDVVTPEALWACRACGACAEICPVGIEHPVKIVKMRRALVEWGEMDPILRGVLETIANVGNSFGEPARKRGSWTRELPFQVKDARREPVEALWFVGDFASFDPRSQGVSRTVARIFAKAGLDFGLLYDGERNAGNDIRRVGEEGLYETLSGHNAGQLQQARFDWVVTTDPHSFNTIRNEYPEFGARVAIRHYSAVLADMLESGRLKVKRPLGKRVTLHDPCHLGRFNGEYEAPRRVLRAIGCEIVEMPRCRDNSFCCGAGGGRIWVPDPPGTEKPAHSRMHEAAALGGIDVFVTCCPKDLTMFEDARKTSGHEADFVVADLAELVAEAIELKAIAPGQIPALIDRITEAVADRVIARLVPELSRALAANAASLPAPAVAPVAAIAARETAASPAVPVEAPPLAPAGIAPAISAPPAATGADVEMMPIAPLDATEWCIAPRRPAVIAGYAAPAKTGCRILVGVKHVAKLGDEFGFRADGRDVRPDDLEYQLNEWDETAIEAAMQIVEARGAGEVVAVCIGPAEAEGSIRKALAKGAARAVRLWQDGLSVSDPMTNAALLAAVAEAEGADLVLTGVQASDVANGATTAATAAMLGWAHAAVVVGLAWDGGPRLDIERELEGGLRHAATLPVPAVLSIQAGANTPRYATMRMIKDAKKKALVVVEDIALGDGAAGAVVASMALPPVGQATMIEGTPAEMAAAVAQLIRDKRG